MKHLIDTCGGSESDHQDYLNTKALEGWELVNVIQEKESDFFKYFFKKDDSKKELQHHKDTTVELYAFEKALDNIFENTPNKELCKTVVEAYLVQQIEHLKSIVFRIS